MTFEEIQEFVARTAGEDIPTVAKYTTFKVSEKGSAFVFELTSGMTRNESFEWMKTSLEIFNQTGSVRVKDYNHSQNTSYVLGLFVAAKEAKSGDQLTADLEAIQGDGTTGATSKMALVSARIGQGAFREALLSDWGGKCAVTGSITLNAIRASHIKPWRSSSNEERLDPSNGLPLTANLDALFDVGLISFAEDGKLISSPRLSAQEQILFDLECKTLRRRPSRNTATYLEYHRKFVFVSDEDPTVSKITHDVHPA